MSVKVLSVGGSIIAPDKPDIEFIKGFVAMVRGYLGNCASRKLILVAGGGAPARVYQKAYRDILGEHGKAVAQDYIGIAATRLNAWLLKGALGDLCVEAVVENPTAPIGEASKIGKEGFRGQVLVAAGWKPGFSSDNDAVLLAERFGATTVVNLSNIDKVYTSDPRKDPKATPIDSISWEDFIAMVGEEWTPGKNTPFDPIAAKRARDLGLKVICAKGANIDNTRAIIEDRDFIGTVIH